MRFFLTCDPTNVRHIFTKNFANYPKGEDFAAVFAVLSGTIFTADGESWRQQRAKIQHVLTRPRLLDFMSRSCGEKVAGGLVPLLTRMADTGTPVDMDDMLGRLVFDLTVKLAFGEDPGCLSKGMPPVPVAAALDTLMGVAFFRHTVPVSCWKMMRRLNIGPEKKLAKAESVLHGFVTEMIQRRIASTRHTNGDVNTVDILSNYISSDPDYLTDSGEPTDFLHKTFINFLVALRDPVGAALPWFVYNLATNPDAVSRICKELAPIAARKRAVSDGSAIVIFEPDETKDLVYLRVALYESLRLYPSGPIERKSVLAEDVLPSGHKVHAGDTVLVSVYAMGRMESVWGEDCRNYRPERWLNDDRAGLRYVPSYKFVSFNTGPRSCPGKNIAVAQMTSVAATVMWNFDVKVVEGHAVEPKLSVVLQMKNGLMVNVNKREEYM
ncbi:hypothetical protein QOZ80_8AG0624330 [Eleusine coracana subsp. coracana]|nr:hypothetical protein QOZ80_8AG0624330 [Eleusine coracana subsp. coracana]